MEQSLNITDIKKKKASEYAVFVNGEYYCSVDYQALVDHNISVNEDISANSLELAVRDTEKRKAKAKAFNMLSRRDYSEAELNQKLTRLTDQTDARQITSRMKELGLIDDKKYAEKIVNEYGCRKAFPIARVRYELKKRGVDNQLAEEMLQKYMPEPKEQIAGLLKKKYAKNLDSQDGVKKVFSALVRLGFSYDDVRAALRDFLELSTGG